LPFDVAQGGESLDSARDPEPVEGLIEPFRILEVYQGERLDSTGISGAKDY